MSPWPSRWKLGKRPAKFDARTLQLRTVAAELPYVPKTWNFDKAHEEAGIPTPMFKNDVYGDCVIAGRAHQTLRMEYREQAKVVPITDDDVLREYWLESGGEGPSYDNGLVMLDSLKAWRKRGWDVGGANHRIHAFASVNRYEPDELKAAAYLLTGLNTGLALPESAQAQLELGEPWDVTGKGPSWRPGTWGGHCVVFHSYDEEGLIGVTWGLRQKATWRWIARYADEVYAVVDDRNRATTYPGMDVELLDEYLRQIAA